MALHAKHAIPNSGVHDETWMGCHKVNGENCKYKAQMALDCNCIDSEIQVGAPTCIERSCPSCKI